MQVAHKNYGQYFTAIEATINTCDPCPTNHCRHQQIFFKSSFYRNFERNSLALAFLFLLLFCPFGFPFCPPFVVLPKIRLVLVSVDAKWWDLYAQGGAVEGVLLHCTALLVALVYYRSARMQCASICWTEREGSLSGRYNLECNGLGQLTLNFILFRCVLKYFL